MKNYSCKRLSIIINLSIEMLMKPAENCIGCVKKMLLFLKKSMHPLKQSKPV